MFLALAVSVILRHLFERRAVNVDDILGTLCGYLLAAMAWANVYAMIELLAPGAFDVAGPIRPALGQWHERESLFLYFSLTTLTTIGYGDVTPVASAARSAATLEGVFGPVLRRRGGGTTGRVQACRSGQSRAARIGTRRISAGAPQVR